MNGSLKLSSESIIELGKLIELMDEDAATLNMSQAISDYIVPILSSLLGEVEANRELIVSTADRASLAILLNEKTFMGELVTAIADHFVTISEELSPTIDPESKVGVAMSEIQELLATWMSLNVDAAEDVQDEDDEDDDEEGDDEDSDEDDGEDDEGGDVVAENIEEEKPSEDESV